MTDHGPLRFSADLIDAAAVEGQAHSRSAQQQLEHWARVGRALVCGSPAQRERVTSALAGRLPNEALTEHELAVVNAEVSAAIEAKVEELNLGDVLASTGHPSIGLDGDGRVVERSPDGSEKVVGDG